MAYEGRDNRNDLSRANGHGYPPAAGSASDARDGRASAYSPSQPHPSRRQQASPRNTAATQTPRRDTPAKQAPHRDAGSPPPRTSRRDAAPRAAAARRGSTPASAPASAPAAASAAATSRKRTAVPDNPANKPYKMGYIPALDGLRTLAVLGVIAYHMSLPWMAGGLLGVTVFFVLSGYLITSLLIQELRESNKIDLPHFWLRRVRRLFPAILLVICVTAILCGLFNRGLLTKMRPDILPSLLFVNNWWQIFHDVSYFEAMGAPSPIAHFWSLAIEEQFYVVWPVLLLVAYKLGANNKTMRIIVAVLAAASALAMGLLYEPGADPSRVYYGTDTRAFSLLVGVLFAFLWPAAEVRNSRIAADLTRASRFALDGIGCAALAGLVLMFIFADGMSSFLYYGGLVLCSVLTAIVIAVIVHPSSLLGRLLGCKPLAWLGIRSYGMYLWHYPLLLLLLPLYPGHTEPWWFLLVELALIVAVSAISCKFVEDPIRKGAIGRIAKDLFANRRRGSWRRLLVTRYLPVCIGAAVVLGGAGIAVAFAPEEELDENAKRLIALEEQAASEARQAEIDAAIARTKARATQLKGPAEEWQFLLIGDSVALGASDTLLERHPLSIVDAVTSRWPGQATTVLSSYISDGWQGSAVVFALGTNGPLYDSLEVIGNQIKEELGDGVPLFIVTNRDPHVEWQDSNNEVIAQYCATHENSYVVDWYSASNSHAEYFYDDDTHLDAPGRTAYADLLQETIRAHFPAETGAATTE